MLVDYISMPRNTEHHDHSDAEHDRSGLISDVQVSWEEVSL